MPRVHIKTKASYGKKKTCTHCGQEIRPGENHYSWKKRNQPERARHTRCGRPRASELSGAKTAIIVDAIADTEKEISKWSPEPGAENPVDDLLAVMEPVATQADEVADEYEGNADNLPEGLQGSAQADAMRDVADRLRDWAEGIRNFSPDEDAPEGDDALEDWESWLEVTREAATGTMEDMPTYEG
jgi:hypothetical protein